MDQNKVRKAIYPGTFDPVTYGHLDIIERALDMCDELHVAVVQNVSKKPLWTAEERVELLQIATKKYPKLVISAFSGLTVDYAKRMGIGVMIRGLRATSDFDFEFQMAMMNRKLNDQIQTIFLMQSEKNFYISSTLIKEIVRLGGDAKNFIPAELCGLIEGRILAESK